MRRAMIFRQSSYVALPKIIPQRGILAHLGIIVLPPLKDDADTRQDAENTAVFGRPSLTPLLNAAESSLLWLRASAYGARIQRRFVPTLEVMKTC